MDSMYSNLDVVAGSAAADVEPLTNDSMGSMDAAAMASRLLEAHIVAQRVLLRLFPVASALNGTAGGLRTHRPGWISWLP